MQSSGGGRRGQTRGAGAVCSRSPQALSTGSVRCRCCRVSLLLCFVACVCSAWSGAARRRQKAARARARRGHNGGEDNNRRTTTATETGQTEHEGGTTHTAQRTTRRATDKSAGKVGRLRTRLGGAGAEQTENKRSQLSHNDIISFCSRLCDILSRRWCDRTAPRRKHGGRGGR